MYYLTTTSNRKNAKRHIALKSNDLEYLRNRGRDIKSINKFYVFEIYNGKWELVERL